MNTSEKKINKEKYKFTYININEMRFEYYFFN